MIDIENDEKYQDFLKKKSGRAVATKDLYYFCMKNFCSFIEKTPTQIHDLHKQDLDNRVPEYSMWLSKALDEYIFYLQEHEKNYSYNTIKKFIVVIRTFFKAFKLKPIPEVEITKEYVGEDTKYQLKTADIRKAISESRLTYQTLFLVLAQTGLSLGDALLLDAIDFIESVSERDENLLVKEELTLKEAIYRVKNEENIIGCFDLRRKKTKKYEFYTFIGPEALRTIALLLQSKEEELLVHDAPIFMKERARLLKKNRDDFILQDLRLSEAAVERFVGRLHERGVFPKIMVNGKKRNYFRPHKIRKWYMNQLKYKAHFQIDDVKYLSGQRTGDVVEHYIDPNCYSALKDNYVKALPYLAIRDEITIAEDTEAIKKLEKENQDLREQMLSQQEQHTAEMAQLKAGIPKEIRENAGNIFTELIEKYNKEAKEDTKLKFVISSLMAKEAYKNK